MDIERARDLLRGKRQEFLELREGLTGSVQLDDAQQEADSSLSSADQHPADNATQTSERTQARAVEDDLVSRIASIDRALGRIEAGEYGYCEVCGREIEEARLGARPDARFCIEHREESERLEGK
ncbi:MAG: TraR/DksA C4-type zinc finger protein [Acidimicrobiia bacterium]